jgi:hypothetical protein
LALPGILKDTPIKGQGFLKTFEMGKLIIKYMSGKAESLKCKTIQKAWQIIDKRANIQSWQFIEPGRKLKPFKTPEKKIEQLNLTETRRKIQEKVIESKFNQALPWNW